MLLMKGDFNKFDKSWTNREEANYIHWTRGEPQNQIQFAFRQHFITFEQICEENNEVEFKSIGKQNFERE